MFTIQTDNNGGI